MPEEAFLSMDVSGDGTVDVADAAYLMKFYAFSLLPYEDMTTEELWSQVMGYDMSKDIAKAQAYIEYLLENYGDKYQ